MTAEGSQSSVDDVGRLAVAAGVLGWSWAEAAQGVVGPVEARAFAAANRLPQGLSPPIAAVMQAGNVLAAGVASGAAWWWGRPDLAVRLGASGVASWALCKVVKRRVGRGRPEATLEEVRVRGRAQRGLGFPSGHSAVATTLASVATPAVPPVAAAGLWATAATVGLGRVYVGAHLPHDVVGGAALGVLVAGVDRRVGPALGSAVGGLLPASPHRSARG